MITVKELRLLVKEVVVAAELEPAVDDREIESFIAGMRTGIGLLVINTVRRTATDCTLFSLNEPTFELVEGWKDRFLMHLQATSGIPKKVCSTILVTLEDKIKVLLSDQNQVEIERIGTWQRSDTGYSLALDNELKAVLKHV